MRADVGMPELVRIRVLVGEKHLLREAARKRGVSLSEFVRSTAIETASATSMNVSPV